MGTEKKKSGIVSELYFWAQACVFALVILLCINVFFFRLSGVNGYSMEPTLNNKDHIVMRVFNYDIPERGDVVVVMPPPEFDTKPLVKRVIGIGGDVIDIDEQTGNVSVNGEVLVEPYIAERIRRMGEREYPYTVPEGHVFVMGDNRNASRDSRWFDVGTIPYEHVVGKVLLRLWPLNKFGLVK